MSASASTRQRGRLLASYLILPRPGDLGKAWILPFGFLVGAVASSEAGAKEVLCGLVVWFALEGLVYPARYQWNDIRGYADDLRHPDAARRGRLPAKRPGGLSPVRASAVTAVARLVLVAGIALAFTPTLSPLALLLPGTAVFGLAAMYEYVKGRIRKAEENPPPVGPAIAAVWVLVGGGYAIRALTGFALVIPILDEPLLAAAGALAAWTLGIAFVTSRWAVEALPFARNRSGRLAWSPEPASGREHTLALGRWLPDPGSVQDLAVWRPHLTRARFGAPWNVSYAAALVFAAATGVLLALHAGSDRIWAAGIPLLVTLVVRLRFVRASVNGILGRESPDSTKPDDRFVHGSAREGVRA